MIEKEDKRPEDIEDDPLSAFEQVNAPTKKRQKRFGTETGLLIAIIALTAALVVLVITLLPLLKPQSSASSDSGADSSANNQSTDSTTASSDETVYPIINKANSTIKEKIVQAVTIQNENDRYTLQYNKAQTVYQLVGYEDMTVDTGISTLIDNVTTLNGYDRVKVVEKLSDFGLDKPEIVLNITYHDNSTLTLHVGNETPDKNGYYACLKDSNDVYMVDSGVISYFQLTKGQCVARTLLASPTVKTDDADGTVVLKDLVLKDKDGKKLVLRKANQSDGIEFSYASYVITTPYLRMVKESVGDTLSGFTYLISSEATVLHPSAADKEQYGFNKPYAIAQITLAVESVMSSDTDDEEEDTLYYYNTVTSTVTVGNKDENGNYYVMINGHNAIYRIAASSLSGIAERTYENTVSELLFLKNIVDIGKITLSNDGNVHTLILTHDAKAEDADKQLTVTCNDKKLSTQNFRELYSLMIGIQRYDQSVSAVSGQPKHTLDLFLNNGAKYMSFEFFEHSASLYTVRTTEGELFTITKSSYDKLLTQVDNLLAGREVTDS